jgi:hypothetical protein
MTNIRTSVAASFAAVTTVTALAVAATISDSFTASTLSSIWTRYSDGDITLAPKTGVLLATARGSGTAAVVTEGYEVGGGNWKAVVTMRQALSAAKLGRDSSIHAVMGLQYGAIEDGFDLSEQINGYIVGVDISNYSYDEDFYRVESRVSWSMREHGDVTDGYHEERFTRMLLGNIGAKYTLSDDTLVLNAGSFSETFYFFSETAEEIGFSGKPNIYLGVQADGNVSGKIFTFDNFKLSGPGVVVSE